MPTVFFFPWIQSIEAVELEGLGLRLVPYRRGSEPAGAGDAWQAALDGVLGNYGDRSTLSLDGDPRPVQSATLVEWVNDSIDTKHTDQTLDDRMQVGQWIAFSALACRRFGSHFDYCNYDDLQFIAQNFEISNPRAVAFSGRRRDGGSVSYLSVSKEAPTFLRPHHAQAERVKLDASLLNALLKLEPSAFMEKVSSAISVFVRANTDAPGFPAQSELTLMRVACETLLESGYKTECVQDAFNKHFELDLPVPAEWGVGALTETTWRRCYPKWVSRPIDAWVQDFCASRNRGAHGKDPNAKHPEPVWSVENHLLFISWLFPLMVKKELADVGLYELSDYDKDFRSSIEQFFAHNIFARNDANKLAWCEVVDEIESRDLGRLIEKNAAKVLSNG